MSVCWLRQHASSQLAPPRATRSAPVAWALCARRLRRARSPPRATRSALGARRCAPRALRACVPGRPGRRSRWLPSPPRATRSAPMAWALRARAPIRQPGRGLALRARRRWRRRCTPERLHVLPPITRVLPLGGGEVEDVVRFAPIETLGARRASRSCRGGGWGGVSRDIIMHERAGQRLRATAACAVRVGAACLCNRSALPPSQTPTPRTLSARARLHAPLLECGERGVT